METLGIVLMGVSITTVMLVASSTKRKDGEVAKGLEAFVLLSALAGLLSGAGMFFWFAMPPRDKVWLTQHPFIAAGIGLTILAVTGLMRLPLLLAARSKGKKQSPENEHADL